MLIGLRFREGFQTAFKTLAVSRVRLTACRVWCTTRRAASSVSRTTSTPGVGLANAATRIVARFNNVPEGMRLFVSTTSVPVRSECTGNASAPTHRCLNGWRRRWRDFSRRLRSCPSAQLGNPASAERRPHAGCGSLVTGRYGHGGLGSHRRQLRRPSTPCSSSLGSVRGQYRRTTCRVSEPRGYG